MGIRRERHLVSTGWLADNLAIPDLAIVDATWYLPGDTRNPLAEYEEAHIPGAVFFDIDEIADSASTVPHMLSTPTRFAASVRHLGIGDGKHIIVYDRHGLFSAARVWWNFVAMGVEHVAVLDGGFPKWQAEGHLIESGIRMPQDRHFSARRQAGRISDRQDVLSVIDRGGGQIVDARSPGRFNGTEAEPRPGVRSGHIPGSINIPYSQLLGQDHTLKSSSELTEIFDKAKIDLGQPIITSCGSGITAPIIALALESLGARHVSVYDGSWAEWGADESLPLEAVSA